MNQKSIERKQMRPRTRSRIVCLKAVLRVAACLALLLVPAVLFPLTPTALASEGGASTYTPGTYGDFGMNILPKGLSIRENIAYTYGKIEQFPAVIPNTAIPVTPELKDKVWFSLLQVIYSTDFKILGGRYFADINIPVDFNLKVETHLGPLSEESEDSGLDDIRVVPFGLLWDRGNFHFLAAENIIVPTGNYERAKTANLGRNYGSFDTIFGLTWLDFPRGHQISFTMGYESNMENDDTHYRTGDEFHLDYILAQYLSPEFGVGLVGYYYKQITADSGSGYDELNAAFLGRLDGFKSTGGGLGPAVMWAPKVAGRPLVIIAKWLYEYQGDNRYKGGWAYISASMSF